MSDLPVDPNLLLRIAAMQQSKPITAPQQTTTFFNPAVQALGLTPQEQFLYQHHLNNLYSLNGGAPVAQPSGDVSTALQAVVTGPDGRYYNIPTVWGGQALSPQDAQARAEAVGWNRWPAYATSEAADARYEDMHSYMGRDLGEWRATNPPVAPQMTPVPSPVPSPKAE